MEWISVLKSVPDDRRRVLTWGEVHIPPFGKAEKTEFLGSTHFNPSRSGVGRFDIEIRRAFDFGNYKVTHWAEIEGPTDALPPPPPTECEKIIDIARRLIDRANADKPYIAELMELCEALPEVPAREPECELTIDEIDEAVNSAYEDAPVVGGRAIAKAVLAAAARKRRGKTPNT